MNEAAVFAEWTEELQDDPTYIVHGMLCEVTEAICVAMQQRGITQAELARRLGVSPQYVHEFLNTPANTTLKQIVRFAGAVGLDVSLALTAHDDAEASEREVEEVSA